MNTLHTLRTLATGGKLLGLAAALVLGLGTASANTAHASNTPVSTGQSSPPALVTIVPDTNPIYLAAGQTQGVAGVTIQVSGGEGWLQFCVNHGADEVPFALTAMVSQHLQVPVLLGQNVVKAYWYPAGSAGFFPCGTGAFSAAAEELQVYPLAHVVECLACISGAQTGTLAPAAP